MATPNERIFFIRRHPLQLTCKLLHCRNGSIGVQKLFVSELEEYCNIYNCLDQLIIHHLGTTFTVMLVMPSRLNIFCALVAC